MNGADARIPLVAHIIDELPPDGAERLLVDLMRRRSGRYRYVIVCLVKGGPLEQEFAQLDVPVVIMWRKSKLDLAMLLRLRRWLVEAAVDVVHTHLFTADVFGRVAARLAGIRAVFSTSHNLNEWKSKSHRIVDRALAGITSRVVGCTQEVGRVLVERDGLSPDKVRVVENGVDLLRFENVSAGGVRAEWTISDDAIFLVVVGRLHPQKGHSDLLEALVELRGLTDKNIRCLFVGDGELRDSLEREVDERALRDVVIFAGLRNDVPRFLVAADVFVMPSRWEGLPIAMLEAMACGKAIVTTAVGGIPSVIEDDVNGVILPAREPSLMASALARVIGDPELRRTLGARARAVALDKYDVARTLTSYEALYDEVRLGNLVSTTQPA